MKRAYVSLLLFSLSAFVFVLTGCEEIVDEGPGNGYIELHIDATDIDSEKHYYYRGLNTSDNTYFSSESRTGSAIITNLGNFQSPLLNTGTWSCDVYELTEQHAGSEVPDPAIVTRRSTGNEVTVVKDEITQITILLAP